MKKIIISILCAAAVAMMPTVLFAATFNTNAQDYPTLRVTNYTTNPSCTTCWSGTASANPGNIVSFSIYYHNTGTDTANNVRVRLTPQTTAQGATHSFTATVSADNAPAVTGTATVTLSSNQTLSYLSGQTIWRPNQTQFGSTALPFGQTGAELFNGIGLNLGNIAPGWSTQGGVAVRFQVSGTSTGGGYYGTYAPTVTTQGVSGVSGDSAILLGYADPAGSYDTMRWFEWGTSGNLGYHTSHYSQGNTAGNFSATINGLMPNTTYYYRAVAQGSQGVVYGNTLTFLSSNSGWYNYNNYNNYNYNNSCGAGGYCYGYTNTVLVNTRTADVLGNNGAVLNGYIDPMGANDIVRWFEWGSSSSLGNETQKYAHGTFPASFNATLTGLASNTTYHYRAVARGVQGTIYGNTFSFNTGYSTSVSNTITSVGSAPAVTTLLATEIASSEAKLNGLVLSSGGQSSNAWFEWGESSSFGNRTATVAVGSLPSVLHNVVISGLVSGRTYYYRIVAENSYGRVQGSTLSFVAGTTSATVDTPVVVSTTPRVASNVTVVGRTTGVSSPLTLSIEGGAEAITNGEKRVYHIAWKNVNGGVLKNMVLRVMLPPVLNVESTTNGVYMKNDNTVAVDVGTLASGASGNAFIVANVNNTLQNDQLVVVTANMVYTDARNAQGDAVAYLTHKGIRSAGGLGANIFGAGSFVPTTLFEWVVLLVLVLILVLLGNHLYGRFSEGH